MPQKAAAEKEALANWKDFLDKHKGYSKNQKKQLSKARDLENEVKKEEARRNTRYLELQRSLQGKERDKKKLAKHEKKLQAKMTKADAKLMQNHYDKGLYARMKQQKYDAGLTITDQRTTKERLEGDRRRVYAQWNLDDGPLRDAEAKYDQYHKQYEVYQAKFKKSNRAAYGALKEEREQQIVLSREALKNELTDQDVLSTDLAEEMLEHASIKYDKLVHEGLPKDMFGFVEDGPKKDGDFIVWRQDRKANVFKVTVYDQVTPTFVSITLTINAARGTLMQKGLTLR